MQQVVERAGYRVVGETGSALITRDNRWSFYIWATEGTPEEIRRAERWQALGTVEGVVVYGDEDLWRWWATEDFVVGLQAGPYEDSQPPPLAEMDSLVRASETVLPPGR